MSKKIVEYQRAFNSIIDTLNKNQNVVAVTVFGSILTGDIWEDSDIDLFVIVNEEFKGVKDIYGQDDEIYVHVKLLSINEFLDLTKHYVGGSTLHRKFISSKLIISKSRQITDKFTMVKYYTDFDRERWNLVYLGKLLKDISGCKKFIHNEKFYSAFPMLIDAIDNFSKLYLNFNGYLVSKSSISMLVNLNDEFEKLFNEFVAKANRENLEKIISYIENYLNKNIRMICKILIDYLCENQVYLSSQEIKNSETFKGFNIEMEEILEELSKKRITERNIRPYNSILGEKIIDERVFIIKTT